MFIVPAEASLRLETTLPLMVRSKRNGDNLEIDEFDCTLDIAWWQATDDEYDWEIRSICFDGPTPVYVTPDTDPAFWVLVERATRNNKRLDEVIIDRIFEEAV